MLTRAIGDGVQGSPIVSDDLLAQDRVVRVRVQYRKVGDGYESTSPHTYFSSRYRRAITVPSGFFSDGATGAVDIETDAWWIHDVLCRYGRWDDGVRCSQWQASTVLFDILIRDGYWFRAPFWWLATLLFGGGATREGRIY